MVERRRSSSMLKRKEGAEMFKSRKRTFGLIVKFLPILL
jgi:hypothetical protein